MTEGVRLETYLNEFNRILTKVLVLEQKIEDEDKILLMLASLPASFDHIVTTLLSKRDTLNLDEMIALLFINESRQKSNGEVTPSQSYALSIVSEG